MVDPVGKIPLLLKGRVVPPPPVCDLSMRVFWSGTSDECPAAPTGCPPPPVDLVVSGIERFPRPVWGLSIPRFESEPAGAFCWELVIPPIWMNVRAPPSSGGSDDAEKDGE